MSRPTLETDEPGLQCCISGCRRRWANDYGYGRMCSMHDVDRRAERRAEKAQSAIPDLPPARPHWQEETDDEPLPF